jgi:hypothetical protein
VDARSSVSASLDARVVRHGDADRFGAYQRAIAHNARWFARLN